MGYLSEEGKIFFLGRCKDLIIHGGENISPNEVEEFLRRHEAVEDAAVVGIPDLQYGENVFAFVRLKPGHEIGQEELIRWCRGKIATIKIPQMIEFVDAFPVSASGKIDWLGTEKTGLRSLRDVREGIEKGSGLLWQNSLRLKRLQS